MKKMITLLLLSTSVAFTQGTIIKDSFYSVLLNETRTLNVYLPEYYNSNDTSQRFPVVYYLHGMGTSQNDGNAIISSLLNTLISSNKLNPVIVVFPNCSMNPTTSKVPWIYTDYANSELYGPFEDFIVYDIVKHIDSSYNTDSSRNFRSILGFSMGGYAALKIGLKYPDIYHCSASLDGYVSLTSCFTKNWFMDEIKSEYSGIGPFDPNSGWAIEFMYVDAGAFSPNLSNPHYFVDLPIDTNFVIVDSVMDKWEIQNITHIANQYSKDPELSIYFDTGTDATTTNYTENLELQTTFDINNIPYQFSIYDGSHDQYLGQRLDRSFTFIDSVIWDGYPRLIGLANFPLFADKGLDTLSIVADVTNPTNDLLSCSAIIVDSEGYEIFSPQKEWEGDKELDFRFLAPNKEDFFRVDLDIYDKNSEGRIIRIYDLVKFTTAGPVVLDTFSIVTQDTLIGIKDIYLNNLSQSIKTTKVTAKISTIDTNVIFISQPELWFNDISPNEKKKSFAGTLIFNVRNNPTELKFLVEISSNNYPYWYDTLVVNFNPTDVHNSKTDTPIIFKLNQNYPNPFNPTTTIKYSIPQINVGTENFPSVQIKIYDILGKEVITIVNQKQKPGNYEVRWDGFSASGGQVPSGIYFYQLKTDNYSMTKKMIYIK